VSAAGRPRAGVGPLVSDEQLDGDLAFVEDVLQPMRIGRWETEVADLGAGEPVLLVPILAHVEVIYARQLRGLSPRYRTITYRRLESTSSFVTIADRVREVRELLDALEVDRAHVVGRGEGAIVAAEFAAAHPDRCRSLAMIGLGLRHKVPPTIVTNALNWALLHLPVEGRLLTDDAWRKKVVGFLSGSDQRLTYDQLWRVYARIPEFIRVCKFSVTPLVHHYDLRPKAPTLRVPTLLVTTDEDPRATPKDLAELATALPNCRGVRVVPHGGRFVNYIQGDEVNRLLLEFYDAVGAATPAKEAVA
jgi:pimeloyl-ACP methyl ester carboxylesterase